MIEFRPRGKGWRRGPPDRIVAAPSYQAVHAARVSRDTVPPASASIEDLVLDVLDQGQEGSCVAHGMGQAVRCCQVRAMYATPTHLIDPAHPFVPSTQDSYAFARELDGSPLSDDAGTFVATMAEVYQTVGFAPARIAYSDSPDAWSARPTAEYERDAFDQAGRSETSIHQILGTDDERWLAVQQAIAGRFPVVWAGTVGKAFASNAFDPTVPIDPPADPDGGHCMMLADYGPGVARIVNSWSAQWGARGSFLASKAFVLSASELFVVEHVSIEGVTS